MRNSRETIRKIGWDGFLESIRYTLTDRWYEWRLGVDTVRTGVPARGSEARDDSVDYTPIPYGPLFELLERAKATPDTYLLDYGSGAGRVLLAAGAYGVRQAIGLDIRSDLVDIANENLRRARGVRHTGFEVHCIDATDFDVPPEVDLIHFFKPFTGLTLRKVLESIERSFRDHPRRIDIIFFNDQEFRGMAESTDWLHLTADGVALSRTRWPIQWGLYEAIVGARGASD